MKIDTFQLVAIGFIAGLILGSMIPLKFMIALTILWIIFGAAHMTFKNVKR